MASSITAPQRSESSSNSISTNSSIRSPGSKSLPSPQGTCSWGYQVFDRPRCRSISSAAVGASSWRRTSSATTGSSGSGVRVSVRVGEAIGGQTFRAGEPLPAPYPAAAPQYPAVGSTMPISGSPAANRRTFSLTRAASRGTAISGVLPTCGVMITFGIAQRG